MYTQQTTQTTVILQNKFLDIIHRSKLNNIESNW